MFRFTLHCSMRGDQYADIFAALGREEMYVRTTQAGESMHEALALARIAYIRSGIEGERPQFSTHATT